MSKTTACACRAFEFGEFDGGNEDAVSYGTECNQTTTRVFAQGHDAKLVGFLVRAQLAGEEIRRAAGGVVHTFPGAVAAASAISDALAAKAQAQLAAAKARLAKTAAREATKAARKSAKAAATPEPELATAKVGRWTYEGAIGPVTKDFVYRNKAGEMVSVPEGKYTLV